MIIYVNIMLSVLLTFHIVSREFFFSKLYFFLFGSFIVVELFA